MDGASSIRLDDHRRIFVFNDTFYGSWTSDGHRDFDGAIDNSAFIVNDTEASSCFPGVSFVGGRTPERIVSPPRESTDEHRLWPTHGFVDSNDSLALFFGYVRADPSAGFGFVAAGSGIARGRANPPFVDARDVPVQAAHEPPLGSALLVVDDIAYVYRCASGSQFEEGGWFPCLIAQTTTEALLDPTSYRYFVRGQGYVGSLSEASIAIEGAPDFTVTYNDYLGRYLMVYTEPFSTTVSIRTAEAPEGPFSDRTDVWNCTLPSPESFCYAGKEHEGLVGEDGRQIALTYNTNTIEHGELVRNPDLYWPRLVVIDLHDFDL